MHRKRQDKTLNKWHRITEGPGISRDEIVPYDGNDTHNLEETIKEQTRLMVSLPWNPTDPT